MLNIFATDYALSIYDQIIEHICDVVTVISFPSVKPIMDYLICIAESVNDLSVQIIIDEGW